MAANSSGAAYACDEWGVSVRREQCRCFVGTLDPRFLLCGSLLPSGRCSLAELLVADATRETSEHRVEIVVRVELPGAAGRKDRHDGGGRFFYDYHMITLVGANDDWYIDAYDNISSLFFPNR